MTWPPSNMSSDFNMQQAMNYLNNLYPTGRFFRDQKYLGYERIARPFGSPRVVLARSVNNEAFHLEDTFKNTNFAFTDT